MSQKAETRFRNNKVTPFLKRLANTVYFSIQQVSICGDPDFILCCNGHFVALELKAPGEEPRPYQQFKLEAVSHAGGISLVARPDNWAMIAYVLASLDAGADPKSIMDLVHSGTEFVFAAHVFYF